MAPMALREAAPIIFRRVRVAPRTAVLGCPVPAMVGKWVALRTAAGWPAPAMGLATVRAWVDPDPGMAVGWQVPAMGRAWVDPRMAAGWPAPAMGLDMVRVWAASSTTAVRA